MYGRPMLPLVRAIFTSISMSFKKTAPKRKTFTVLLALLSFISSSAQLVIDDQVGKNVSVRPHAELFQAGQFAYDIDQILGERGNLPFAPLEETDENYGFSNDHFWLRFEIRNATEDVQDYYLETARPITDDVTLYLIGQDGKMETQFSGDRIAFEDKIISHRKSVFSIVLPPGEALRCFLHLKSDGEVVMFPLNLYGHEEYLERTYGEQLFYGFFYGVLMLAFILYLFFFFALRDALFVYYSGYVLCIAMLQFSLDGHFHQYIAPGGGWISDHAVLLSALFSLIFLAKYGQGFLALHKHARYLDMVFTGICGIAAVCILVLIFVPGFMAFGYPAANVLGLSMLMLIVASVIYLKRKKVAVDNYFVAGFAFLIIGFVVFISNNLNLLPNSFFTENGAKFGIGMEVIFLSISMSNRIRNLRKENEGNQRLALQRAQDMNEIKSSFLSNISHELRTPLNLIMGVATSLGGSEREDGIADKRRLILESSETLLGHIEDILDFTIIEKEGQELEEEPFDLAGTIDRTVATSRRKAEVKGLKFDCVLKGIPSRNVIGDHKKLRQILNNLLDNAVKFTPSGAIAIHIECCEMEGNRLEFNFNVSDTGIGISEGKMSTIYESFAKRSYGDKREFSGLGLGLYIVKNFIDLQNGTVDIRNDPSSPGTICSVCLEYTMVAKEKKEAETALDTSMATKDNYDLEGCRILLVEDNEMNQFVVRLSVKQWRNATLAIANNGAEALDMLRERPYDIILMDLQMPVMDGFETMATIRSGKVAGSVTDIPIIVVTADVTEGTKKEIFRLGANAYLTKPIKADLLFHKIVENLIKVD